MKADLDIKNTNLLQIMMDDRYRILRHVVLLLASFVLIFYSNWQAEYSGSFKYYRILCVYGVLITMCYINMYILVPVFFFTGRYVFYLAFLAILVLLFLNFISILLNDFLPPQGGNYKEYDKGFFEGFFITVSIILITTMIKLFQRWTKDNERIADLNNITLRMELNELRNQINPHFLFNMLNGIKALVRSDPEKASIVIMKLSEFLRYQIYDNNEEKTPLRSEITFLSNFLNLEMLRRDKLFVDISLPDNLETFNTIFIPPNLFTTFVENAVKHSVDIGGGEPYIIIKFEIVDTELHFFCVNSKDPGFTPNDEKHSGLGLVNIKRRLELLYQDKYFLTIDSTENQFSILLKLPL